MENYAIYDLVYVILIISWYNNNNISLMSLVIQCAYIIYTYELMYVEFI